MVCFDASIIFSTFRLSSRRLWDAWYWGVRWMAAGDCHLKVMIQNAQAVVVNDESTDMPKVLDLDISL